MKLEVGMYVRFANYDKSCQYIGKLENISKFREPNKKNTVYVSWYDDYLFMSDEDIVKASHKLIDLIHKGDYVNGYKVLWVYNTEIAKSGPLYVVIDNHDYGESRIMEEDIKDIVTKEQFNSVKYVVGK